MASIRRFALLCLGFSFFPVLFCLGETATAPFSLNFEMEGVRYSEGIPEPEKVLGHVIGTRHTRPHQVVSYFESVAKASDRVVLGVHGSTYEGRPLIHAIVTSRENHSKLESIRQRNLLLSDQPEKVKESELDDWPVIAVMGYGVHGNEASGPEAAMLLLYHLAAGEGKVVDGLLSDLVVIIDPMLNPDGRSRFVNWANQYRGRIPTADPADTEHNEPWPGGRTNHYWFDMNRDWLPAQLKESQGRLELFHKWRPQVMTDFHEMGGDSTFFFQPGIPSRTNPLTPEETSNLTEQIAKFHALALDRIGSLYFSKESFDDFYYGKGSTYPDVNGAVGILFEQASSRSLQRETEDGILHFDFTVRNQFAASLSTLEASLKLKKNLLANQRNFYLSSRQIAQEDPIKGFVFSDPTGGQLDFKLVEIMLRHRIQVFELGKDISLEGASFQKGKAFIVPMSQPQTRLISSMMKSVTEFRDTVFYDVSTWLFPAALSVTHKPLLEDSQPFLGKKVLATPTLEGKRVGGEAEYAYLMKWTSPLAPSALYQLQLAGAAVRALTRSTKLQVGGEPVVFDQSSLVIPVRQSKLSKAEVHQLIKKVVDEHHVEVYSVSTGLSLSGPDLGSPSSPLLAQPKIALVCGAKIRSYEAGEVWFVLNEQLGIPISLIDSDRLGNLDLSRYNTIILVSGSVGGPQEAQVETLKNWVRKGGLLVTLREGTRWAIQQGFADARLKTVEEPAIEVPYDQVQQARTSQRVAGAIFKTRLDVTHPLAYGISPDLCFFRDHEVFVEPSAKPGTNVALYTQDPLLSGYAPAKKVEAIAGTAAVIAQRVGAGSVVLFTDNPNFRAFWLGSSRLFVNSLFFGRAF